MYQNLASANLPATLIYLVDVSGSMKAPMFGGKSRIDIAKESLQTAFAQMIQRSLRQGKISPRYRVAVIAYSADLYNIYGGIIPVDKLKDEGIPPLTPQHGTDMAKVFKYAYKLIEDDIKTWTPDWLNGCPPPMVINITDNEYDKEANDVFEYVQKIKNISIPDGNVLMQNIFITDEITLPVEAVKDWKGYDFSDSTGNPYADNLLRISSAFPSTYAQVMREQSGLKISDGVAMMFPGINREFIRTGFVMSVVTGYQPLRSDVVYPPTHADEKVIFDPRPGMQLDLDDEIIEFTPLEATGPASVYVYAETGKEGTVYKVLKISIPYALKVFHPDYQNGRLIKCTEILRQYRNMTGLRAADRLIINYKTHPKLINIFPELNHSILMPWIQGDLWQNMMNDEQPLDGEKYFQIALSLTRTLYKLESKGLAHCDLSGGNTLINSDQCSIELIDIENLYASNMPRPIPGISYGTVGYRNRWIAENGLWGLEGDRFPGAILCSEIMAWGYKEIRENKATDNSFFDQHEIGENSDRYLLMKDCLNRISPELTILFEQAWFSDKPSTCPSFYEWKNVLEKLENPVYKEKKGGISKVKVVAPSDSRLLRVFLCHSSGDKPKARRLYRQLINEGWIDPWLDEIKLEPGQDWDREIRRALRSADVIIVCLSTQSVTKEGYIQKEIKMALDIATEKPESKIFIIPLKWDDCKVPDLLQQWQWVDVSSKFWYKKLEKSLEIRALELGIELF